MYRQGDVLIIKIQKLPINIVEKENTVAYGEVTGHSHRFVGNQVQVYENMEHDQFVHVTKKSNLIHEEHDTIAFDEGFYKIILQREFDIVEGIRRVMD